MAKEDITVKELRERMHLLARQLGTMLTETERNLPVFIEHITFVRDECQDGEKFVVAIHWELGY